MNTSPKESAMSRLFSLGLIALTALALAADPEPEDDRKRILGTWAPVRIEKADEKTPDEAVQLRFEFTAKELRIRQPGVPDKKSTYKLYPGKKPGWIDLVPFEGGKLVQGIYRLDGGRLIVHTHRPGGDRPKTFEERPDTLLVLKRSPAIKDK
jgi:uncharacterized protein (TIGR03067 family)